MIGFTCSECGKELQLEKKIFDKAYKGHEKCLSCRSHGGYREGAGRPSLGKTKKVSITLPDDIWEQVEKEKGDLTMSAFFREMILNRSKP